MRKKASFLICALISIISLMSCSGIIQWTMGMKDVQQIDKATIIDYGKRYGIQEEDLYEVDSTYLNFLSSFDSTKFQLQIKNHYQPLQVLYYDKSGYLKSFQVNCYAGGFPNLKWNKDDMFSSFIPKQLAPIDSIVPLDVHLNYLNKLTNAGGNDKLGRYDFFCNTPLN